MTTDRPLKLLRFALESRDVPLATALAHAMGARAEAFLRDMPRVAGPYGERRLLRAALELVATPRLTSPNRR